MSKAVQTVLAAHAKAMRVRPKIGGFPYLAEAYREGGVISNTFNLPSGQSIYITKNGPVAMPGPSNLITEAVDVPVFSKEAIKAAIQFSQKGEGTFPEFLALAWKAGVIKYDVDYVNRKIVYVGVQGEQYEEDIPAVTIKDE